MTYLSVHDVDVSFDEKVVLSNVGLTVERGELVALLGPSGSGKSTLLRVIAGIITPDAGRVELDGHDISETATHKRGVGMVFQDNQLFPHLSVGDNVAFSLKLSGVRAADRRARAADFLELVGLGGFAGRRVNELSGGEAKRVALARTLIAEPRVVLLDEPLTGLDRELHDHLALEVRDILREQQVTAILVTHDHDEAATIATRILRIDELSR